MLISAGDATRGGAILRDVDEGIVRHSRPIQHARHLPHGVSRAVASNPHDGGDKLVIPDAAIVRAGHGAQFTDTGQPETPTQRGLRRDVRRRPSSRQGIVTAGEDLSGASEAAGGRRLEPGPKGDAINHIHIAINRIAAMTSLPRCRHRMSKWIWPVKAPGTVVIAVRLSSSVYSRSR